MNKDSLLNKEMAGVQQAHRTLFLAVLFLCSLFFLSACSSHMKKAKFHYAQGQEYSRRYLAEDATASFKRALKEAEHVVLRRPSSQGYMLKGMAELNLKLWEEAEESFRNAHSYGFENGEEWAQQISLLGLAASLEELGVEEAPLRIYTYLIARSKFTPVTIMAAQRYMDAELWKALQNEGNEREKLLTSTLKAAQKLSDKDLSCGFYHYLQSQVYSHLADYKKSFEEALMARELGLPTEKIFRDNDLQIIFCYRKLKEELSSDEWGDFQTRYLVWVKKWKWRGPETPDWKKEK